MISRFVRRPPAWFIVLAVLLVLWGLAGCASLYMHLTLGADMGPNATDWDRRYYASLPVWIDMVYSLAVGAGLAGAIGLLLKRRIATTFSAIAVIAVIIQFGWIFIATDMIAAKGVWTTYFPATILLVQLFQLWIARRAKRRGWLR